MGMNLKRLGMGVVVIVTAVWAGDVVLASQEREGISPRVTEPVEIDGRLNEAAWEQAATLGQLVTLGDGAQTQYDHTEVWVTHDLEALYLAVICAAEPADDLPSLGRNAADIWNHERIEVFVDPFPETEEYFQLVVDRAGNMWDARIDPESSSPRHTAWDGEWRAATSQTEEGWILEMAIPFAALEASAPKPGDLWRLRVCRDGGREGSLAWPHNPTSGFHSRLADAALYFEKDNLLANPDFEEGDPSPHVPPPWRATMTSGEVDDAPQGTVETVSGEGIAPDSRAVRMTKLSSAMWWPQIWSPGHLLDPGAVYEFSIEARGDLPQITLRANTMVSDQRVRLMDTYDTPEEWTRLRYVFSVPEEADTVSVGLSAPQGISGEIFFDRAVLRRTIAPDGEVDHSQPLTHEPDPDPVQGLDAFMERQGEKPYDLFERRDELLSLRLIFEDRQFGTPVWMLDTSPTVEHGGTASVWSAWNSDASTIRLEGTRPIDGSPHRGWYFNEDFSRLKPGVGGRPAVWDPENPDVFYGPVSPQDNVTRTNIRTGEQEILTEWEPLSWPASGKRIYGLTRDLRHVFVDLPNRGVFVPFEPDDEYPIPVLPLYDGRPVGPEGVSIGSNHFTVIRDHPDHGDLIALRTGMLVDRETGETTYIAAPLCGNTNYLRAFYEGRVHYPEGDEWNAYGLPWFAEGVRLPKELSMEELHDLWRNIPHATHGHESTSPDWEYIATDGGTTRIVRVRDGDTRSVRLSPNGSNYHLHWRNHDRFFVGWVRGWHFGSYMRPHNANIEFQIFADGTFQPIVDTKHRFNGYYSGGDFSMLSPDATKIHYGSSMTGRFRNYIAVMARPRPPADLSWEEEEDAVALSWTASSHHRETRGYLVYRGETSGGPYELLTPEPVEETSWRDQAVRSGQPYYYVVTSLEHSGLESGYSMEAARAGVELPSDLDNAPLRIYVEAEDAVRDLPTGALPGLTMGVDRREASDWYYLYRHPDSEKGEAELAVEIPVEGEYSVWTRVRSAGLERGLWEISLGDHSLSAETMANEWTWVRADGGPLSLPVGPTQIRLTTEDAAARMDLIVLATDEAFVPSGPRPEEQIRPSPPQQLQAENIRERVNHLTWENSGDPAFSHFQVYGSREADFEPSQETLLGSPTYGEFIDWGLRAGTEYHYAVTTVDRRGNESDPVRTQAATPAADASPVALELAFADAEQTGPFERSTAGGTRADAFLVPEDPENNRVAWRVEIPREGDYYLWLRHLLRGDGGRGGDVRQEIRVRVNGSQVATLGGGLTDLNIRESLLEEDPSVASRFWTWAWPGEYNLQATPLPAGEVEIVLENLAPDVRYDVLYITDDPSFVPDDGRLRQR